VRVAAKSSETRTIYCNPDARVRVENDAGLVEVTAWEHDRVELVVERHAADAADLDRLTIEVSGGPAEVRVACTTPELPTGAWVDLRLRAPRMSSPDLHNGSGEVLVSGFHGSSRAATASGSIRAARMSGTATLTSASGAILGAALEGRVFARSASGPVSLHGNLTGSHRVETASGEIVVDGVDGSIDARTTSGSIDVRGVLRGRCTVRSVSGDIRLSLLRGSDVAVRSRGMAPIYQHPRAGGILVIETVSGEIQLEQED
jgi:hypothetical protein